MLILLNAPNLEAAYITSVVTLFVGVIAFIGTVWISYNKNKAEIKSKPRIEWIQEVRKLSAEYVTNIFDYLTLLEKIYVIEKGNITELEELGRLKLLELTKNKNLLKMYYGEQSTASYFLIVKVFTKKIDNQENIKMNKEIDKLFNDLICIEAKYKNKNISDNDLKTFNPDSFIKSCQIYFKEEWEKAKENV